MYFVRYNWCVSATCVCVSTTGSSDGGFGKRRRSSEGGGGLGLYLGDKELLLGADQDDVCIVVLCMPDGILGGVMVKKH